MAKRIFEIANELGVPSKSIVAKCQAEGIPESVVKNHMSAISAGLEASIRDWFSGGQQVETGGTATAIETSAKIDVTSVRAKARRKAGQAEDGHATPSGDPAAAAVAPTAHSGGATSGARKPDAGHAHDAPGAHTPGRVEKPYPISPDQSDETKHLAAKVLPPKPPVEPKPPHEVARKQPVPTPTLRPTVLSPVTVTPTTPPETDSGSGPSEAPAVAAKISEPHRGSGVAPAPAPSTIRMNVPTRPTGVTPAGPKLENRAPVKMAGPKVVRVEAPEVIEAPRPRRTTGPGTMNSNTTGNAGTRSPRPGSGPGQTDDDRNRSPRRKQAGPGGPGSSAGAGGARSTGSGVPQRRRASSGQEWIGNTQGVFSAQDLIEREARLQRAGGFLKKRRQDLKKAGEHHAQAEPGPAEGKVRIPAPFTIKQLSAVTGVKGADIVKKLFLEGVMATINSGIDPAKAQEIMIDFDIDLEVVEAKSAEEVVSSQFEGRENVDQRRRGPVVTILGHVDHGKTSLLDRIRNAKVAAGEAGGITQRTSAFRVPVKVGDENKVIVFLDTPGHEAFTSMRSRGANMTDVVVLVVSAPEGVMPQTLESINHAKAAKVPIVVALNKIDRPDATEAQIQRTLGKLAEAGLNPVEWGGDTEIVRTSATTGVGIQELLDTLDYQAELKELKADFGGPARGTVIEAKTEGGRGAVASILVQDGKLKVGDFIVAGRAFGKVRDITDDRGERIKEALPPIPVQISGIDEVPNAGDRFFVVDSLKKAQEAAEQRRMREREAQLATPKVTLDNLFTQMSDKDLKEILIVLKAAEQGTLDVLKSECEKIATSEVKVRVLHTAIGGITESDVLLADASKAIIVGFNVIPSGKARSLAENKGVEIRTYDVIYNITDDLKKAAEGLLTPELRQEVLGHAEVRKVFKVSKVGSIAGCYVTDGTVQRDALIRVTRNGVVIENNRKLAQLKRFKDDAKEVRAGMECGMKIDGYDDIKEGDVLECYKQVEVKRTL